MGSPAAGALANPLAFAFGILGNAISFAVYFAPLPTFYRIYRRGSTEGFKSLPYVVALFSATLWVYYAFVKQTDTLLLKTINSFGCLIETIYIIIFLIYAPRNAKISTVKLIVCLNILTFGLIVVCTLLLAHGHKRILILGWICVFFSVAVFAAPLSVMRLVVTTRSVEFMPLSLSLSLTLSAVTWFLYGLFLKDYYVAMPNVLGFMLGLAQMILYMCYRNARPNVVFTAPDHHQVVVDMASLRNGTTPLEITIDRSTPDQLVDPSTPLGLGNININIISEEEQNKIKRSILGERDGSRESQRHG